MLLGVAVDLMVKHEAVTFYLWVQFPPVTPNNIKGLKMILERDLYFGFDGQVKDIVTVDRILNEKEINMLSMSSSLACSGAIGDPFDGGYILPKELSKILGYDSKPVSECTNWGFISSSDDDINWADIKGSLSYAEPLALVTRKFRDFTEVANYVVVSKQLLHKANSVDMFDDMPSITDTIGKRVFEINGNFSEWVTWAKAVKAASWDEPIKSKISVILPKV